MSGKFIVVCKYAVLVTAGRRYNLGMESLAANSGEHAEAGRPPGLRERSKARRRAQIQRTAMRLLAERGYDSATVADIADAAEVAPRTVTGYFQSKADLALSYADETATRLT